jgi:hypothetical protein
MTGFAHQFSDALRAVFTPRKLTPPLLVAFSDPHFYRMIVVTLAEQFASKRKQHAGTVCDYFTIAVS